MKQLIANTFICIILLTSCNSDKQWQELIKDDLSNWEQLNGTAPFQLTNGEIVGTTVINTGNSFLCTREKYGDFILEFDTWFDHRINSGVQIRSESRPDYQEGRVHGYQVEMDPSPRAWSGGIYDEARRGWLYPLTHNPEGQKALKVGEWNHYRIEAIGNSIRTWINGVPCADLIDGMTDSGFIGLQVHSIGADTALDGLQVRWKNIRIITDNPSSHATPYQPVIPQYSFLDNELTEREKAEGWKLLFDGRSASGWMNAKTRSFPASGWEIRDGALTLAPELKGPDGGGDIVTTDAFRNYELIFDFMYFDGSNSGIKYFVDIDYDNGALASIGCEYQILDDRLHPDDIADSGGKHALAGLYDLIPPRDVRDNGPEKWNRASIIVKGNKVQHWLNGQITVDYIRSDEQWRKLVAGSKYKDFKGFGEAETGRILLQDHGTPVSFKNIKIRELQ